MPRNVWLAAAIAAVASAGCGGSPTIVSDGPAGSFESALAAFPDRLVAGWYDTRDGNGEIYIRELDEAGRPAGPEQRLTSDPEESYEVSLDAADEVKGQRQALLAVAWYDKAAAGTLTGRVGVWNRRGQQQWLQPLGPGTRNPVVRARGDRLFCAWIGRGDGGESVWSRWWDVSGAALGAPRRLGPASRTTWNLNAAIDGAGVAWVVWDAFDGTASDELYMGRVDNASSSSERISGDDGVSSKYPDIAIDRGRRAVAWFDAVGVNTEVYLQVGTTVRRVTRTKGESIGAYLAWNGDRIGLAWSDNTVGQHEVYFQPFDAAGAALAEVRRISWGAASSLIPAVRSWRSGFALAWNEYTPQSDSGRGASSRSAIATAIVR